MIQNTKWQAEYDDQVEYALEYTWTIGLKGCPHPPMETADGPFAYV